MYFTDGCKRDHDEEEGGLEGPLPHPVRLAVAVQLVAVVRRDVHQERHELVQVVIGLKKHVLQAYR